MRCEFVRDTEKHEDVVLHRKGDVVDLASEASVQRWVRRGAVKVIEPGYVAPVDPDAASPVDYEAMTVKALGELAESRGIELPARPKKADIVEALEAYDRGDVEVVTDDDEDDDADSGNE